MVAEPTQRESPYLQAALAYAQERNWHVFPLLPNLKKPFKDTRGYLDATNDVPLIRALWTRWPSANVGIATGASGLVVIDEDLYEGADLSDWMLPPTLTAQSARDGRHRFFRYAGKLPNVPQGKLGQGICIKADGGYVVAAPSRFQGKAYTWIDPHQPVADLPERIAALIRGDARRTPSGERQRPPAQRRAAGSSAEGDAGAHWLAWALQKTGMGMGDPVGYELAQQLLIEERNGASVDVDGVLMDYARQATLIPTDPFTQRDADRWKRSAAESELVRRAEPARSRSASVTKPPKHVTKAADGGTNAPYPGKSVTDRAEPVTEEEAEAEKPAGGDAATLRFSADDNGNAEAMNHLFGREFLYTTAYGWLQWKQTHWGVVPDAIVERYAIAVLKRRRHAAVEQHHEAIIKVTKCDRQKVTGCVALFRTYVIEPDVAVFDRDRDLLNCQNGVLNLRTGALTPHDMAQRFTYCVPVDYNPRADMSLWQRYVLQAVGNDQAVAEYLQTCAGYSITGHTRAEKLFYIYGPTRAGKGTFTETMLALLPHPLSEEVDFNSFTAKRDNDSQNFDLAELKPARMVIASESNPHQSLNPAKIKQLTGGNKIRCAFKHKDIFSYRPQFKVWLVSNHPVNADAADDALWGRVQVIDFPNSHLGAEDVTLKERLQSNANLQGVLRWTVIGAQRWYREDRLSPPASVVAATREHREAQDYLKQWIDECCTLEPQTWTSSKQLLHSYQNWCDVVGVKPEPANIFSEQLTKRFNCTPKRQAGTGTRGHLGIALGVTHLQTPPLGMSQP